MFAHNREAIRLSYYVFNVGYDVRGHDGEVAGVGTDCFILWDGDGDHARAIALAAFADDAEVVVWRFSLGLLDLLIDLAGSRFVLRYPLFPLTHDHRSLPRNHWDERGVSSIPPAQTTCA